MGITLDMEGGGVLRMWEDSGRAVFFCHRPMSGDGIYKVWLDGDRGEVLLGTLVPEGDKLALHRAVWPGELQRCGCWPIRRARCAMAYPFHDQSQWCWEDHPERLVDTETAEAGEWCRMLLHKERDGFSLAVPVMKDRPLPLVHLFCMARPGKIMGRSCLIWRFDGVGRPLWPDQDMR